jgi:hypothetical protein
MVTEISRRIMASNRAYCNNMELLKSTLLSRHSKVKFYKTLIRPVVTYGPCPSQTVSLLTLSQAFLMSVKARITSFSHSHHFSITCRIEKIKSISLL